MILKLSLANLSSIGFLLSELICFLTSYHLTLHAKGFIVNLSMSDIDNKLLRFLVDNNFMSFTKFSPSMLRCDPSKSSNRVFSSEGNFSLPLKNSFSRSAVRPKKYERIKSRNRLFRSTYLLRVNILNVQSMIPCEA